MQLKEKVNSVWKVTLGNINRKKQEILQFYRNKCQQL